jgi:hypothetical protein
MERAHVQTGLQSGELESIISLIHAASSRTAMDRLKSATIIELANKMMTGVDKKQ